MILDAYGKTVETRSNSTVSDAEDWLVASLGGGPESTSGVSVNHDTARNYSVYWACVTKIAQIVGMLPCLVYKRNTDGSRERATGHQVHKLIHGRPNRYMGPMAFKETLTAHLLTHGNAFAEIERDKAKTRIIGLWPIPPHLVKIHVSEDGGNIYYEVKQPDGSEKIIKWEDMLHVHGLGYNGYKGYDPITYMRDSLGLGIALEEMGSRFAQNDATPGGVITVEKRLNDAALNRMRQSWQETHGGVENKYRAAILEEGAKWQSIQTSPGAAQYIQSRTFQAEECCRWFHMQPHKVGLLARSTNNNIEHQGLEFKTDTIAPWTTRWAEAINLQLIGQQDTYYAEFEFGQLLQADKKTEMEALSIGVSGGLMRPNEGRARLNLPLDPDGDKLLIPSGMVPAGTSFGGSKPTDETKPDETKPDEARRSIEQRANGRKAIVYQQRARERFRPVLTEAVSRVDRRENVDVRRAVGKYSNAAAMRRWVDQYYAQHERAMTEILTPAMESYAGSMFDAASYELSKDMQPPEHVTMFARDYTQWLSKRTVDAHRGQLQALLTEREEDFSEAIEERVGEWEEKNDGKLIDSELVNAGSAFVMSAYALMGVTKTRWQTGGDSCPWCNQMNGRVVEIQGSYVEANSTLENGEGETMTIYESITRPQLHQGCDCYVLAAME